MPTLINLSQILLLGCFGLPALYAFFSNLKTLRSFRAPRKYAGQRFAWAERPYSGFKYELDTWLAITLHRLALFSAGLAGLYLLFSRPVLDLSIPGIPGSIAGLIAFPILAGCVAGIGFFWGQASFGPLAEYLAGDSHYAVSDEGVLTGGQLFPWTIFAYYSLNDERTALTLWSASFPGATAFNLMPPVEQVSSLISLIQIHLPAGGAATPGFIRRSAFPALMAVLLIFSIIIAIAAASLSSGLAIVLIVVFMYLLVWFGGHMIMKLIYGGQNRPATLE
jgi:hypothetical protein